MSIRDKAVNGVKWTTVSTVVIASTAILKISILARFLDKTDFGLMALVTFTMGFMQLFNDMGLSSAILHKQNISEKEYSSLYWFNLFFGTILYLLLLILTPFIANFYGEPELKILLPLLGLHLVIAALGRQFMVVEQKKMEFKRISLIEIISTVLSLFLSVILAANDYGVYSLVWSALFQFSFSNFYFLIIGIKRTGLLLHFSYYETKPFLRIGSFQVGGQIVNYFNRDLDILIVGKFFSTEALGGYSLAKQLVFRPAQLLNPILVKVASPTLALYQDNIEDLKKHYLKLVNIVSSLNIPVYSGIIIFAPWLVNILYGEGFENIIGLVRILSVYMVLRAIGNPIGSLVIATGRTDVELVWNLIALLIMPIFILIGSQFNVEGIALGVTLSMLVLYIPSWRFLIYKMLGVSLKDYFKACFLLNFQFIRK